MKRSTIITVALVVLVAGTSPAYANPLLPDMFGLSGNIYLFLLIAMSSLLVEFLLVRKLLHPWVKFQHVLPVFLFINIVSFPLTTILGVYVVWIAEILPLTIEPPMYWLFLREMGYDVPNLSARIIGANLASFVVGVVAYNVFCV